MGKGVYKLGRVLKVHPDAHGVVRTITVGMRRSDVREPTLPYVPKALDEIKLGVQRVAVICPVEEQNVDVTGEAVVEQNEAVEAVIEQNETVETVEGEK